MGVLKDGADQAAELAGATSDAADAIADASADLRRSVARFETDAAGTARQGANAA
jgi:hypothetical protein